MEEFPTIFAAFVKYWWLGVAFHAGIHYPIWLMKAGRWAEIWAGPDR